MTMRINMPFENRTDAGRRLASRLLSLRDESPIVLALPRGGVPVGYQVARALGAPLDVVIARKIGAPGQPELALGAVAEGGGRWVNEAVKAALEMTDEELERLASSKAREIAPRQRLFRGQRPMMDVANRTVILVDDGLATGATARAALRAIRVRGPRRIVLATPVAARETLNELYDEVDEIVCLEAPEALWAIGNWYEEFGPVGDDEVVRLLEASRQEPSLEPNEIAIPVDAGVLGGTLRIPRGAHALVVFSHGSGSSRLSVRNRHVASALHEAGFATLLFDLLTEDEEADDQATQSYRFDIALLATRLIHATDWLASQPATSSLRIGYFGASTGAAAALMAAAHLGSGVGAVVSRGGRPDLAKDALRSVVAPTLLIVGGLDDAVLDLNREALSELRTRKELVIIPGATHLFEEPGALDEVVRHAAAWFERHLLHAVEDRPAP